MNEVKTCNNCGYRKKSGFFNIFGKDMCILSGKTCENTRVYSGSVCGVHFDNWVPTEDLLKKYNIRNVKRNTYTEDDIDLIGKG